MFSCGLFRECTYRFSIFFVSDGILIEDLEIHFFIRIFILYFHLKYCMFNFFNQIFTFCISAHIYKFYI